MLFCPSFFLQNLWPITFCVPFTFKGMIRVKQKMNQSFQISLQNGGKIDSILWGELEPGGLVKNRVRKCHATVPLMDIFKPNTFKCMQCQQAKSNPRNCHQIYVLYLVLVFVSGYLKICW